jgi:hypothetical protein
MARRVMAAICAPMPAKSASSSSVSPVTMVLSMSASSSAFCRARVLTVIASIGLASSAASSCSGPGGVESGMSTASPGDRITGGAPRRGLRMGLMMAGVRVIASRRATMVVT